MNSDTVTLVIAFLGFLSGVGGILVQWGRGKTDSADIVQKMTLRLTEKYEARVMALETESGVLRAELEQVKSKLSDALACLDDVVDGANVLHGQLVGRRITPLYTPPHGSVDIAIADRVAKSSAMLPTSRSAQ